VRVNTRKCRRSLAAGCSMTDESAAKIGLFRGFTAGGRSGTFGAPGKQQIVSGPGSPNPAIGNSIPEPLGTIPVGENR
jgi:hypothetical protein